MALKTVDSYICSKMVHPLEGKGGQVANSMRCDAPLQKAPSLGTQALGPSPESTILTIVI